jgi:pimeloyl-ACP methyl ester carboxylesterase
MKNATPSAEMLMPPLAPSGELQLLPPLEQHDVNIDHMDFHYSLRNGDGTTSNRVTIIVPGFYGIESGYTDLRDNLALSGMSTVTLGQPRKHDLWHPRLNHLMSPGNMLSKTVWGTMRDLSEQHGITEFDLLCHSMGGLVGTNAAEHVMTTKPRAGITVKTVTLCASAGVTNDSGIGLGPMAVPHLCEEVFDNLDVLSETLASSDCLTKTVQELIKYSVRLQIVAEAVSANRCDVKARAKRLGKAGVATAGLYFGADRLFRAAEAEKNLTPIVNAFSVMDKPGLAGHLATWLYPKEVAASYLDLRAELAA